MASAAFEDIADTFEFLDDWEDRYRHVIELGKAMDPLDDAFRVPATKVDGCASQVWLVPEVDGSGGTATFRFKGDSDAMIVRGLIAILVEVYSGESPDSILETPPSFIDDLGLSSHLSQNRANGLSAMIKQMKMYAAAFKAMAARGA